MKHNLINLSSTVIINQKKQVSLVDDLIFEAE